MVQRVVERVVLADDDPLWRRLLADELEQSGRQVVLSQDGQEALDALLQQPADLLIVNYDMPLLDGAALCRLARALPAAQPFYVLLLVDRQRPQQWHSTLDCGADDFLLKPLCLDEFRARLRCVEQVLSVKRQLQQAQQSALAAWADLKTRAREITATRDVAVFALAKLAESRDPETGVHLERLRDYSQILAEQLARRGPYRDQIDRQFLEDLYRSSPLHDVGKVGIPDSILRKPGKLTPEEFEIMKRHTHIGAEALEQAAHHTGSGGFLKMAVEIARYHHERFDGSGYPTGLAGTHIPLPARIVALADVYDALTSVRVYKPAFPAEMAHRMILEQSGRHFDPAIVAAYQARREEFLHVQSALQEPLPGAAAAVPMTGASAGNSAAEPTGGMIPLGLSLSSAPAI